ncbi:ATP-dependent DNA helicase PIF1 [Paramuricea clavata]|uniref:ATP-dependent DNA helicase n=1 Tax=Paramuricea clavata TaxID=317549 RepID=A0A7D9I8Q2_PARCT|nr:ATP-dependent DNA helicase PIF1 [Paramuricea clavata]
MWTKGQEDALKAAKTGHNLCIFGKSGCGKSTIIKEINKTLTQSGRVCKIVCPSGVACKVYDELAATVHSFYGLQTAELPAPLVMQRSLQRSDVVNQIQSVDVLVWDVISMSSLRIFHIVDLLHQKVRNNSLPFSGIQVILGGDFCQLKPIQSLLDPGDPINKSVLFGAVFPHRIVLEKIMRQSEFEGDFKKALDSLRMGVCDVDTEAYLRGLSRRCVDIGDNVPPPIHIFFKKLPVEVHNSYMLWTGLLKNTVPKVLMLKRGCKVMLLFNISKSLTNETLGTFIDADQTDSKNESLLIKFPNVGVVSIPRKTWYAYRKHGQVQASRTQFPLSLSYAITVHKAQSATLESAVVHCSQEFDAGQTYVALSRVKSEERLQVIGFQKRFLLKQPAHIEQIHSAQHGDPVSSFTCCRNKVLESTNCELDREEVHH